MLDPAERHGQGKVFLDVFLKHTKLKEIINGYKVVAVNIEEYTDKGRRIDITLSFDNGRFGIGIENKFWAVDQEQQVVDYCTHLSGKHKEVYHLIYLSPEARLPALHSINNIQWRNLENLKRISPFDQHVLADRLIDEWISCCKADSVRHFLKQYKAALAHLLDGTTNMNNKIVVDFINERPEHMQFAVDIANNIESAFPELFEKLKDDLHEIARMNGLLLEYYYMNLNEKDCGFRFDGGLIANLPFTIAFEWEGKWLSMGYWGFPNRNKEASADVTAQLNDLFSSSDESASWHYYKQWDAYKNFSYQTFADISTGKFQKDVQQELKNILAKLKNYNSITL